MAITNYDGIIASRGAGKGEDIFCIKGAAGGVTGNWFAYMKASGFPSSVVHTAATSGGKLMTSTDICATPLSPTTGDSKYLLAFGGGVVGGIEVAALCVADVLWAGGSIQVGSSSTQTINSIALNRCTDGVGVMIGVNVATALTTASTMTIWYTDSDDNATLTNVVLSTAGIARMLPSGYLFTPLVAGDRGVKSIQSVQVQTAQTAGAVDIMLFKPITIIPTVAMNSWVEKDMTAQIDGLYQLAQDSSNYTACLQVFGFTNGSTARAVQYQVRTCAG